MKNLDYREDELSGYTESPVQMLPNEPLMEEVKRVPGTFGDPARPFKVFRTFTLIWIFDHPRANPEDSAVYVDGIRVPSSIT